MAPQFVQPYVQSNKNAPADAEALWEAVTRPTMRCVPVKAVDQQDRQSWPRARERVVKARTALVNEIRGVGGAYGFVLPQGVARLRQTCTATLEAARAPRTSLRRELVAQLSEEVCTLDKRLTYDNEQIAALCEAHPVCQRLGTMPGIGPLTAPALVAAVRDATQCKQGRQCAAWGGGACPGNPPLGARRACSGSGNVAIALCGRSSSTAPGPPSGG